MGTLLSQSSLTAFVRPSVVATLCVRCACSSWWMRALSLLSPRYCGGVCGRWLAFSRSLPQLLSACLLACLLSCSSHLLSSLSSLWYFLRSLAFLRSCFLVGSVLSLSLSRLLAFLFSVLFLPVLSLLVLSSPLSLYSLGYTFGALSRSSRFNLPLVPRGIIHHSFTIRSHSSNSRSFFSLLLVTV